MKEKPATKGPSPFPASPHPGNRGARFHSSSPRNLPLSLVSCCPTGAAVGNGDRPVGRQGKPLAEPRRAAGLVETDRRDHDLPWLLWEVEENQHCILIEVYIECLGLAVIEIFNTLQHVINIQFIYKIRVAFICQMEFQKCIFLSCSIFTF